MKETENKYLRLNKKIKRNFIFEIGNAKIVLLFDTPHLFKKNTK